MSGSLVVTGIDSFAGALKSLYSIDEVARLTYDGHPFLTLLSKEDVVHFETGMTITWSSSHPMTALEVGIAATVALGGLAWMIARRNALAKNKRPTRSWVRACAEWLATFFRTVLNKPAGLFGEDRSVLTEADIISLEPPPCS